MKSYLNRLLSFLLSLAIASGVLVTPGFAVEEKTAEDASATTDVADTQAAEQESAANGAEASGTITVEQNYGSYTVTASGIDAASAVSDVTLPAEDVAVDSNDPATAAVEEELNDMTVLNENGKSVGLTDEQIETVLQMYTQYKQNWEQNADVLGAQMPFYLQYNDDNEDGLGVLGEMLVLAGYTVDDVRSGKYSYDDLTGMITTFYYGDTLGVDYYGDTIRSQRDDALKTVEESGAKTEYQKLLVLNDWLATVDSFDMSYIMNAGEETPSMQAEEATKHAHYDDIYGVMYDFYQPQIEKNFHDQIYEGVKSNLRQQVYEKGIREAAYQAYLRDETNGIADPNNPTEEEQAKANAAIDEWMEENADAIASNPSEFAKENLGEDVKKELDAQADAFISTAETDGIEVDPENAPGVKMTIEQMTQQMLESEDKNVDLDGDGTADASFAEAIALYSDQAASGLTTGVLNYWEGNHIGALAEGKSVCLGYAKAYAYLIQCMHPELYGKDGAGTDMTQAANWKPATELYYDSDGNLDIDADYEVDLVRITFDTSVTMYGETKEGFNSDHFWNAVKVDGKWYYIDPCYNDVYSEVMIRDRVETAGFINHMYFMFSHDTTTALYDGYYSEIKTMYAEAANDKTYEDAWFARAKTNVYSDGSKYYYVYDSTDLISMLEEYNNSQDYSDLMSESARYKLVSRDITDKDNGDGDTDYNALIEFNYSEDEDDELGVARVYNPSTGEMEENELLTELYAKHAEQAEIYPSIFITTALSDGKLYFNLSNCILTYDLESGAVQVVKEYKTTYGTRDKTKAFGGMAFALSESEGTFQFENHPIAGICQDGDNLIVSIATNLAYISGKDDGTRSGSYTADNAENGYGYEYEESNYNPDYSNYKMGDYDDDMIEQFGYTKEINDNDEFMWVANLVGTVPFSELSPVEDFKVSSCKHHYIHFAEQYFTKDDDGNWNTGECYVCTQCGKAVEEPTEPKENANWNQTGTSYEEQKAQYDKDKAEYDEIVASAGHTYQPTDAEWNSDEEGNQTVSFSNLECSADCAQKKNHLDCLINDDTIQVTLEEAVTSTEVEKKVQGNCEEGSEVVYTATGKTAEGYAYTATKTEQQDPGEHSYESTFTWTKGEDGGYTATVDLVCAVCGDEQKGIEATVTEDTTEATCTEAGKTVYTATAAQGDKTYTEDKTIEIPATGHDYESKFTWTENETGGYAATAKLVCSKCNDEQEEVAATVTDKTTAATCTEAGETVYTATVELDGETYTDTKTIEIPATGHKYESKFTWTEAGTGGYTATASLTCEGCGDKKEDVPATVTSDTTDATCTEAGATVYTATAELDGKTYTDTKTVKIPALGHDYDSTFAWAESEDGGYTATANLVCSRCDDKQEGIAATVTDKTTAATCTEAGETVYTATVEQDGKTYTDTQTVELPATGHKYESKFTWTEGEDGGYTATASLTCDNCGDKKENTPATVTAKTTDATCTEAGATVYTATAELDGETYTEDKTVEIPALGHDYTSTFAWAESEDGGYTATANLVCSRCDDKQEGIAATVTDKTTAATCTEAGETVYTATVEQDGKTYTDTQTVELPATGHKYESKFTWTDAEDGGYTATASLTCAGCGDKKEDVPATVTVETTDATCTEAGATVYTATATLEGETYTDTKTEEIPALGHDYTSTFAWAESEDGGYTATVDLVCAVCGDEQKGIAATVTEETKAATCTEAGETVYTATVEQDGKTYTDTKTVELPATGHKYESKFTWTDAEDGGYAATASLGCSRCDGKQAGIAAAVTEQTTAATCTEAGATVYTASAEVEGETYTDIKTVAIPALGHKWDDGVVTKEPTTTESGIKTYTCTVCMQTRTEEIDPLPDDSKPVYEIFSDLSAGAWYIDAIQYAYDNNIMAGMGNGTFEPNSSMTRAMVAQIVYNVAGAPEVSGDIPFVDVPSDRWYSDAILWASQNNVVAGMGDGTFHPNDVITREQYASILYHYEKQPAVSGSLDFPDAAEVGSWAVDAMLWANQRGIITGTKEGDTVLLQPKGSATRAQSAMILMNYLKTAS
ncbi:MAG: S-layer homology domain-containing protein [Eubacteriales bacterium]|nr:S-layer homology domain-containing protein [Eubacteriales bacterium]